MSTMIPASAATAVRRVLDEPGQLPPEVISAAYILAAEALTAGCENCAVCPGLDDLCPDCAASSQLAASFRVLAAGSSR